MQKYISKIPKYVASIGAALTLLSSPVAQGDEVRVDNSKLQEITEESDWVIKAEPYVNMAAVGFFGLFAFAYMAFPQRKVDSSSH